MGTVLLFNQMMSLVADGAQLGPCGCEASCSVIML